MPLLVTIGFTLNATSTKAWDEVYYAPGITPENGIESWLNADFTLARDRLMAARLQYLSRSCSVYYIRSSTIAPDARLSLAQQVNFPGAADAFVDDPSVGPCWIAATNPATAKRQIHLRGVPDSWVVNNALSADGQKGIEGIKGATGFFGRMNGGNGLIRFRNTAIGGPSSKRIIGAAKDGQYGLITIQTESNVGLAVGDKVVLSGLGRQPQLRGTWQVAAIPSTAHYTLRGSERVSCPEALTGYATLFGASYGTMVDFAYTGIREKKCGKKKFLARGKQSAKLIRH